jgi:enoyl-CoA hydratase
MIVESSRDADGIRTITLNRPPANAINFAMMHAIRDAFDEASADWQTRVVILQSSSPKFFSGGWDVKESYPEPETLPDAVPRYGSRMAREVFRAIYECGAPVIAKVRGIAAGAGFLYACLADFAVCSPKASFGQFEMKIGGVGGAGIVRRMMSEQAMRYLTWSAELVGVEELKALGAGAKIVADADLDAEVAALARRLAGRDPRVTRHGKYAFNQVERLGPLEAYAVEQMHSLLLADAPPAGSTHLQPDHVRHPAAALAPAPQR